VLLNGGFRINIITKKLRVQLGLSKPKLPHYNMHMTYQSVAKPLGLIKDVKIIIHGIPYAVTFTSVLDSNYSMLLGRPWLRDVKMFHDWGNDIITIRRASTIRCIPVPKKLGAPTK